MSCTHKFPSSSCGNCDAETIEKLTSELADARSTLDDAKQLIEQKDVILGVKRLEATRAEEALREVTRERDALLAGKWAGKWEPVTDRPWSDHAWVRHHPHGAVVLVCNNGVWRLMKRGVYVDFKALAKEPNADDAKAAADAHLIANGWWLEGGAFKVQKAA